MNARCRTARVCSSSSPSESIGDPISNNNFEFSINFLHLVRQSALLKSHFVKSSVVGPPSPLQVSPKPSRNFHLHALLQPQQVSPLTSRNFHRESYTHPPIPFQCRLSFHCCCCYCCLQLEALLMLPSTLCLSLLFHGRIGHFGLLFQTPFCKWQWFKWRWRWRRRQCRAAAAAASVLVVASNTRC